MLTPILQIIHISDLHFCTVRSDKATLAKDGRWIGLLLQRLIERQNAFGWHEGTLEHDTTATRAFEKFLSELRINDKVWFPKENAPSTWLIDTGDATIFGDQSSMADVHRRLEHWQSLLGIKEMRTIYGNHDAWPGAHPAMQAGQLYIQKAEAQRNQIGAFSQWQEHKWATPLCVDTPFGIRVEVYAANSVSFGFMDSVSALGRIKKQDISKLRDIIASRQNPSVRTLRVLATHHPVAYPYDEKDKRALGLFKQMVLDNSSFVTQELLNERAALTSPGLVPLIHLFLSGHTHLAMPGQALPRNVKEVVQGKLGSRQMQLVGGPLLLVRDRDRVRNGVGDQPILKARKDFSQSWVFEANQQFQILRFHYDPTNPDGLWLQRIVCARTPNGDGYRPVPELRSFTFMELPPTTL